MTVPIERTNAVKRTHRFLLQLLNAKETPRVPKAIREQARSLLRHYPSEYEMDMIADREDGNAQTTYKIFGKDYK